jgi:hypothetical protein
MRPSSLTNERPALGRGPDRVDEAETIEPNDWALPSAIDAQGDPVEGPRPRLGLAPALGASVALFLGAVVDAIVSTY